MLIDEAQAMQTRREPLKSLSLSTSDTEYDDLQHQLMLLDGLCPRYDVHNVYSVLFPTIIESNNSVAMQRNKAAIEKRDQLVTIAAKAPLGPPWFAFCLEHKFSDSQRIGYLVRWNEDNRKYVCTALFDSIRVQGMVEFIPDAFEVHLADDDMFHRSSFKPGLGALNEDAAMRGARLVRTCIELLNWDRDDVATQVLENPKGHKRGEKTGSKTTKSNPTVIKFEPFLKSMNTVSTGAGENHSHQSTGQHLVRGHYQNFRYEKPRFLRPPVLGKTYGRLWVGPHRRGNPQRGGPRAPSAILKLGNLYPDDPTGGALSGEMTLP